LIKRKERLENRRSFYIFFGAKVKKKINTFMNKYQATVKVSGFALKTLVYPANPTHARLLLQQQLGANNVVTIPVMVS
jgi:hypothetical protein